MYILMATFAYTNKIGRVVFMKGRDISVLGGFILITKMMNMVGGFFLAKLTHVLYFIRVISGYASR